MVTENEIPKESVIYVGARVEQWLKDYAESNVYSEYEFTLRVAEFLYLQTSGKISRAINLLSPLRRETAEGNKTSRKMAVVKRAYRKASGVKISKKLKQHVNKGRSYNGKHWMQLPENKARVKKMMKDRRAAYLAKTAA